MMGRLGRVIDQIRTQMGKLGPSQRLLIASLVVIMLMTLFVVQQYTGKPAAVPLLSGVDAADTEEIKSFLTEINEPFTLKGGAIMVPVARKRPLLSMLSQQERLPSDNRFTIEQLVRERTWWATNQQNAQAEIIAVQNEIGAIIGGWKGIRGARVMIDIPTNQPLGAPSRAPTAAVSVVTERGLDQATADAIVRFVASARAGLTPERVRVVDATSGRQFRATEEGEYDASAYQNAVVAVEKRKQASLLNALSYIPDVIVTVHAQVEKTRKQITADKVLNEGQGTASAVKRETVDTSSMKNASAGIEAGVRAMTRADLTAGESGPGQESATRKTETEFATEFGRERSVISDPGGYPTRINAVIGVPRLYFEHVWHQKQGPPAEGAEPPKPPADDDPAFVAVMNSQIERIKSEARLLIQMDSGEGSVGEVAVSMIPTMPEILGANLAGSGGGFGLVGGTLASGEMVRTVALGGLAVMSLALVAFTAMRAGKREKLPTAAELVGLPKALQGDADLVGEAHEADSVLAGIELTDDDMRRRKLQEQVEEMVAKNPEQAASVLGRWVRH